MFDVKPIPEKKALENNDEPNFNMQVEEIIYVESTPLNIQDFENSELKGELSGVELVNKSNFTES